MPTSGNTAGSRSQEEKKDGETYSDYEEELIRQLGNSFNALLSFLKPMLSTFPLMANPLPASILQPEVAAAVEVFSTLY